MRWTWTSSYNDDEHEFTWNGEADDGARDVVWQYNEGGAFWTSHGDFPTLARAQAACERYWAS